MHRPLQDSRSSAGLLVLGMHRSGTSALTRVLQLAGADLGARVLGASAGNQEGHWEDAFAVELHERLLAGFGARWDEPFALPADWERYDAAEAARRDITHYLATDRAGFGVWAAKDPRLSLFGGLWCKAAADLELTLSTIVLLRHPLEVVRSLAVRDGMGAGTAMLLWLDYTLSAVGIAETMPSLVVAYDALLADWHAEAERIRSLPAAAALDFESAEEEIEGSLRKGLRHHVHGDVAGLPAPVAETWRRLNGLKDASGIPVGTTASLREYLAGAIDVLVPFAGDQRLERKRLWERVSRAESQLAPAISLMQAVPAEFDELRQRLDRHQSSIVGAFSSEVLSMQQSQASALQAAAQAQGRAEEASRARMELTRALDEARFELEQTRRDLAVLRAEAERLRAEAERGREAAMWLDRVLHSRSWRLTRPVRVLGRFVRGCWADSDVRKLRLGLRRILVRLPLVPQRIKHAHVITPMLREVDPEPISPVEAAAVGLALTPPPDHLPDVFIWSVIDWHFRTQRPQHLARALAAKGHRVFYMSNNFVDDARPGFAILPLDESGRLFQLHLHVAGAPQIYGALPDKAQSRMLQASLAEVLTWTGTRSSVSIVQHPYWTQISTMVPSPRLAYDCMDHHAGFANNAPAILQSERQLVMDADVVVVTSDELARTVEPNARHVAVVRNGGDFAFFSREPSEVFKDPKQRRIIGYYGAIAEWFDAELIRALAQRFPDALVVLVGSDTAGVGLALAGIENIQFVGEVPYEALPYWLYAFDVCLLPFKVVPLTLATNPVKVYEYLAAGKPVVAVDLPEMRQFDGLVHVAADDAAFVHAVGQMLSGPATQADAAARREFARTQTWTQRADQLDAVLQALPEPRVSVVVLTFNNLPLTQACLASIERHSDYRNVEVVVVDNASTDGSLEWLRAWVTETSGAGHVRRLILNEENIGFAAGNNIGLTASTGDVLVVLNNDTEVTPGWIRGLCAHFRRDPTLGLLGPVTDNIGNEARIELAFSSQQDMLEQAGRYTRAHAGAEFALRTAAFFCVAMPRRVYEAVGAMDEGFGAGFFEDDDYCRRVEAAGFRIACAEDVFVHHHLSASFSKLPSAERQALFERNKAKYEQKWGAWTPHAYRHGNIASD